VILLIKIVAGGLGFYLIYCGLLFFLQRQILFPRYQIPFFSEGIPEPAGLEKIWLNTASGKVEAWFMPPQLPPGSRPAPAVI